MDKESTPEKCIGNHGRLKIVVPSARVGDKKIRAQRLYTVVRLTRKYSCMQYLLVRWRRAYLFFCNERRNASVISNEDNIYFEAKNSGPTRLQCLLSHGAKLFRSMESTHLRIGASKVSYQRAAHAYLQIAFRRLLFSLQRQVQCSYIRGTVSSKIDLFRKKKALVCLTTRTHSGRCRGRELPPYQSRFLKLLQKYAKRGIFQRATLNRSRLYSQRRMFSWALSRLRYASIYRPLNEHRDDGVKHSSHFTHRNAKYVLNALRTHVHTNRSHSRGMLYLKSPLRLVFRRINALIESSRKFHLARCAPIRLLLQRRILWHLLEYQAARNGRREIMQDLVIRTDRKRLTGALKCLSNQIRRRRLCYLSLSAFSGTRARLQECLHSRPRYASTMSSQEFYVAQDVRRLFVALMSRWRRFASMRSTAPRLEDALLARSVFLWRNFFARNTKTARSMQLAENHQLRPYLVMWRLRQSQAISRIAAQGLCSIRRYIRKWRETSYLRQVQLLATAISHNGDRLRKAALSKLSDLCTRYMETQLHLKVFLRFAFDRMRSGLRYPKDMITASKHCMKRSLMSSFVRLRGHHPERFGSTGIAAGAVPLRRALRLWRRHSKAELVYSLRLIMSAVFSRWRCLARAARATRLAFSLRLQTASNRITLARSFWCLKSQLRLQQLLVCAGSYARMGAQSRWLHRWMAVWTSRVSSRHQVKRLLDCLESLHSKLRLQVLSLRFKRWKLVRSKAVIEDGWTSYYSRIALLRWRGLLRVLRHCHNRRVRSIFSKWVYYVYCKLSLRSARCRMLLFTNKIEAR
jgi:hypothetical protein